MKIDESIFSKLTDEQKKKVEAARSKEDFLALAKEFGHELTSEQLDSVAAGGDHWYCPIHDCQAWGM